MRGRDGNQRLRKPIQPHIQIVSNHIPSSSTAPMTPHISTPLSGTSASSMSRPISDAHLQPFHSSHASPFSPHSTSFSSPGASSTVSESRSPGTKRKRSHSPEAEASKAVVGEDGHIQGFLGSISFGHGHDHRSDKTEEEKKQTLRTRKMGACPRCSRLKKSCRPSHSKYLPCDACRMSKPTTNNFPCIRVDPMEAKLFRLKAGNSSEFSPYRSLREDLLATASRVPRTNAWIVAVAQEFGFDVPKILSLDIGVCVPIPGDTTAQIWYNSRGEKKSYEMPLLGCVNIEDSKRTLSKYATDMMCPIIQTQLGDVSQLVWDTFHCACSLSSKYPLVDIALKLWATTRLIEKPWRFEAGHEYFELGAVDDEDSPWHGISPVTPFMDQQLDQLLIGEVLVPYREEFLKLYTSIIQKRRKEDFFQIYLATFVILHNCTRQLVAVRGMAIKYKWTGRYGMLNKKYNVEERCFESSKILIAHFHDTYRGAVVFSQDWNRPDDEDAALFSDQELKHMKQLCKAIKDEKDHFLTLRADACYEHDMHFIHQLFYDNWEPGSNTIKELSE